MDDIELIWNESPDGADKTIASARALERTALSDCHAADAQISKWLAAQQRHNRRTVQNSLATMRKGEPDAHAIADDIDDIGSLIEAQKSVAELNVHVARANSLLAIAMVRRVNADQQRAISYRTACKAALVSARTLERIAIAFRQRKRHSDKW
jgi:hypothetical protein